MLSHLVIIIHHMKALALKFLLESELNEVMGSFIGSASILLAVQPVIAMKVMILPAGAHRRGPDGKVFINIPPLLGAGGHCHAWGARPKFTR